MKKKIKKISIIFVLTVVLFSCLASTCFAYGNVSLFPLNSNYTLIGSVSNSSGTVCAFLLRDSMGNDFYNFDLSILRSFSSAEEFLNTYNVYRGSSSASTWYLNTINTFYNDYSNYYNNGLTIGSTAGKNQVMDEIIQNANSNGTNIENQLYSPQALINVLNEIRNSAEYDGAFNQEDSDILYLVDELIRLGVLAESYDTFELTVDGNLENAKNIWYLDGFEDSEVGVNDRIQNAYDSGYTDGLAESDIAENTILTIFSAPTYILATIFDFELFGINVYALICFFLTLTIVAFILKRVL